MDISLPPPCFNTIFRVPNFLPLDSDFISENASVATPDPIPRIASVHKFRFAIVVLVECWIETVYYYVNGKTLDLLLMQHILLNVDAWLT